MFYLIYLNLREWTGSRNLLTTAKKSPIYKGKHIWHSSSHNRSGQSWNWFETCYRSVHSTVFFPCSVLSSTTLRRSLLMLNRLSQLLRSLQSGAPFLSLNISKRSGNAWLAHQHLMDSQHPSHPASTIFVSGIARQMTQMSTSSALVRAHS
jgi:hypothetical protein